MLGRTEVTSTDRFADSAPKGMDMHFLTMGLDPLNTKLDVITLLTVDCSSLNVAEFIRGLAHGIRLGLWSPDIVTIEAIIDRCASNEGWISLKPFDKRTLERYRDNRGGMPVFHECMRFVLENFEEIGGLSERP